MHACMSRYSGAPASRMPFISMGASSAAVTGACIGTGSASTQPDVRMLEAAGGGGHQMGLHGS